MTVQQGQAGGKPQEAGYGNPCIPQQIPYLVFK